MAQTKIQSAQLSETGVTPGPYTNADVTVDSAGRITVISNGTSVPSLTETEVAYGSPGNTITSTPDFTYNDTAGRLTVGQTGATAFVEAFSSQDIIVSGEGGARFKSNLNTFGINNVGAVEINGSAGTVGQVLTSTGSSTPPTWSPVGGSISAPLNEIVYGTGPGVTSDPDFTFDTTTDTMVVGADADGVVLVATGFSISLESDGGNHNITLTAAGAVNVNGSSGSSGDVLTSAGSGSPAYWAPASGPTPTLVVRLLTSTSVFMDRSMFSSWPIAITSKSSTEAFWDSYTEELSLLVEGFWRITVTGYAKPGAGGYWPNYASVYGTYVSAALSYNQLSQYARTGTSGFGTGWGDLSLAAQVANWTDEFIVDATDGPISFPIALFAESYDGSQPVRFHAVVTAQRIL